ncbi:MAG: hypothetical protein ACI97A_000907 [Planctomycetota bacterium]|jgi:hypothetical protein
MNSGHPDFCAWTEERLELFLDGELSGSENLRFQTHLKECDSCAAYWADDEALCEALLITVAPDIEFRAPLLPNPDFVQNVLDHSDDRPITHHSSSVVVVGRNPFLWSAVSAMAASIVTVFACFGMLKKQSDEDSNFPLVVQVIESGAQIGFSQGQVQMRPTAGGPWRPVTASTKLMSGVDLKTGSDSRLLVHLDSEFGQILLAENSALRIAAFPNADSSTLEMELDAGRLSCDLGDVNLQAGTLGLDLNGSNASFDMTRGENGVIDSIDARLAVTRGYVTACADIGAEKKIEKGQVFAVQNGLLLAFDLLPNLDGGLVNRRRERSTLRDFDVPPVKIETSQRRLTRHERITSEKIEEWLVQIALDGEMKLVDPDEATRDLFGRMRCSGSRALELIRPMMAKEKNPLCRKGLVALVGAMRSERAAEFLKSACEDPALNVRGAAVYCLSRFDDRFSDHFAKMCQSETDRHLKMSTAFLAAQDGEAAGYKELMGLYESSKLNLWRGHVVDVILDIGHDFEGRKQFLVGVIHSCAIAKDWGTLSDAVRGLVETGDVESAKKSLRALLQGSKLGSKMSALVEFQLKAIEN